MKQYQTNQSQNFQEQTMVSKPILSEKFTIQFVNNSKLQDNSLVQFFDKQLRLIFKNSHTFIPLNFDVQFQIIYIQKKTKWTSKQIPIGFIIYYFTSIIKLTFCSEGDHIYIWRRQLAKKIAQKGFNNYYRVLKKIKQQGYWIYSMVQNLQYCKKFMCKGVRKTANEDEKIRKQYQNEIIFSRKLNHYNLLKLYQVRQTEHSIYVIYELVQEKCLAKKMIQTSFSTSQVQLIIKSILQAVAALHQKSILHRNICPQAVFFRKNKNFQCILGKFKDCSHLECQAVVSNELHGTPGYIAPEIFPQDQNRDYQYCFGSDIFSVGAILYELLLEKPLFAGYSKEQKMIKNVSASMNIKLSDFLLPKHDCNFSTKKQGYSLICKLLAQNPKDRPSAKEALTHPFLNTQSVNQNIKRYSESFSTNVNKINSKRSIFRNSSVIPLPHSKIIAAESCQLIESDDQKIDLYSKMQIYQLISNPKFLSK